jgi:hypothetical protein
MLKKMMLLAMAVGALIAFAAPAAAQAQLTFNNATEEFEGVLEFHRPAPPITGTFACNVTVVVTSTGGTDAEVTEFAPTTEECEGTGLFAGCELVGDASNVPFTATANTEDIVVTKPGGDITIANVYSGCAFGIPGSHLEFGEVTAEASLTGNGGIEALTISGISTAGGVTASGTVLAETDHALTLTSD